MASLQEELVQMQNALGQSAEHKEVVIPAPVAPIAPIATQIENNVAPLPGVPVVATSAVPTPTVSVPPVVAPEPAKVEPAAIDNWDVVDSTITTPVVLPTVDFSTIGKDLGLENVRTKEELTAQISAIRQEAARVKQERESFLTNVPEDLAKAVELSKTGGDYLGYLGVTVQDYSKADPIELYEKFVENSLTDPQTGVTDWEKVDVHLDKLDDADLEIRGRQIQLQYVQYQNEQKAVKERQIHEQRIAHERQIRQAVDRLDVVSGFKVSPTHKQDLYNDMLVDPMQEYRKNGGFDYEKLAHDRFIIKNYEKLDRFRQQQIKNAAKREILNEITNPEITKTGTLTSPEVKKGYSLDDLLNDVSKVK